MNFSYWKTWWNRRSQALRGTGSSRRANRSPMRSCLLLENLEERTLPAPLVVTSLLDTLVAGKMNLRQAVQSANASPGDDSISFDPSLLASGPAVIQLTSELMLSDTAGTTTVAGPGTAALAIDGQDVYRIIVVSAGVTAQISGLTLARGFADRGGAIRNFGTLSLTNVDINSSRASAPIDAGGAIWNAGQLTIQSSILHANQAIGGGDGGALWTQGTVVLSNTTLSNNLADRFGGGIRNTTALGGVGSLTLRNATITANRASSGAGAGGGLSHHSGTATLNNTIVAGNVHGTTGLSPDDISGTINTASHNLIGDAGSAGGIQDKSANAAAGNMVGNNGSGTRAIGTVLDQTLRNNGGPTLTHALVSSSPAQDNGDDGVLSGTGALTSDQRGVPFVRKTGAHVDIGAFERQALTLTVGIALDVDNDNYAAADLSLREAVELANANPGTDTITFASGLASPITLLNGQLALTDTTGATTITGPGAATLTIDGNNSSRVFEVASGVTATLSKLTIAHGRGTTGNGGGVLNQGTLTVTDSTVRDNKADGVGGGGGFYSSGTLTIRNSWILNNLATGGNAGGGIANAEGTLLITGSTLSGNSAAFSGAIDNIDGNVTIINSTLSGNSATNSVVEALAAGGIGTYTQNSTANTLVKLVHVTFAGNAAVRASDAKDLAAQVLTGVTGIPTVTLQNTILGSAKAGLPNAAASDGGTITSLGKNISFDATGNLTAPGDRPSTDPRLGPLQSNGGLTPTRALLAGSPAIDAGDNNLARDELGNLLTTDQRGTVRPQGALVDIGAFETVPVPGQLQLNTATYSVQEGAGSLTLTLTRTGGSDGPVSVTVSAAAGGTASAGVDYAGLPLTVSFAGGQLSRTATISILDDTAVQGNVTLNLALSNPTGGATLGTPATATVTIVDEPAGALAFSAAAYTINETGTANLILTRTGGSEGAVSVTVSATGGSAAAGVDYTGLPQTVSFAAGQTSKTVSIATLDDGAVLGNKTITLALTSPTGGATLGTQKTATVTIIDNPADPQPGALVFSAAAYSAQESDSAELTITRISGSAGAVSVTVTATGGSAVAGVDYSGLPATVDFGAGETSKTLSIPTVDDGAALGDKTITLALTSPTGGATLGAQTTAAVTIVDISGVPQAGSLAFSAADYTTNVTSTANLVVTRTGGSDGAVSVTVTAVGGSAVADVDYSGLPVMVNFAAGETSQTVSIPTLNDGAVLGDETILLALTTPTGGATLGAQATATVTIVENPGAAQPGALAFDAAAYSVNESGSVTLTITRTGGSAGAVSVMVQASGGSAVAGVDYTGLPLTISFAAGETSQTVVIPTLDDGAALGDKTIILVLSDATGGATLGTQSTATVTIVDNAAPAQPGVLAFSVTSTSISEDAGTLTLLVTRTGGSDGAVAVQYAVAVPDSLKLKVKSTPGQDFQGALAGSVAFAAGEVQQTIVFTLVNDDLVEVDEIFTVTLTGPTGAAVLDLAATITVTILDADLPIVPDETPTSERLQLAGSGFGKSHEHYVDFVTKAYARFLSRLPEPAGLDYWVTLMKLYESSQHQQGLRQEQIEAGFLNSDEYKGRYGGTTGEAWIRGIYHDLLNREGEPAGVQYWLDRLAAGDSPTNVALGFTSSDERLRNRVGDTYLTLLERAAEPAGLEYWVNIFKAGGTTEDINSGFVGSAEYYGKATGAHGNPARWIREAYLDVLFRPAAVGEMDYWLSFLKG